jgi:hypothetical protein
MARETRRIKETEMKTVPNWPRYMVLRRKPWSERHPIWDETLRFVGCVVMIATFAALAGALV